MDDAAVAGTEGIKVSEIQALASFRGFCPRGDRHFCPSCDSWSPGSIEESPYLCSVRLGKAFRKRKSIKQGEEDSP